MNGKNFFWLNITSTAAIIWSGSIINICIFTDEEIEIRAKSYLKRKAAKSVTEYTATL